MGNFASLNIVLDAFTKDLFFLSTTPFCYGVLGAEYCREIPFSFLQNSFRIAFLNSVPLSDLILTGKISFQLYLLYVINDKLRGFIL